jgi:large repetitive protein
MASLSQSPSKAVITSVGGAIGGGTANSTKPIITGTADAGTVINIYDGVRLIGSAAVAANGTWSFTPPVELKSATHAFTAISIDSQGNWGGSSDPMSVLIRSTAPAAPIIIGLIDSVGPVQGVIASGATTDDPRPALTGTGKAGDVIKLYDNGTQIGSATVGADGKWSVKPTADLAKGNHDLYATETGTGGTSGASAHTTFKFDATVPAKPIINGMTDDSGMPIPSGGATGDPHPSMSGTGTPGDTITMYDGPKPIGSTTVGPDGKWIVTPNPDLSAGTHDIYVIETSPAGVPSVPSDHTAIVIDTSGPATPVITSVIDAVGPVQGNVPSGGTTDDARPTLKGTGRAGDVVTVYDGTDAIGSATVDGSGHWSLQISTARTDGKHDLLAKAKSPAGVTSDASNVWTIMVDTSTPAAPAISSVMDNVGSITGAIAPGGVTDDARPVISGAGKAGDLIKLYDGATQIGSATVGTDGKWSIQPANMLSNGMHDLSATDTNLAGMVSPLSAHFVFAVDATTPATPAAPVITDNGTTIPSGGSVPDGHPVISGTGKAGDTIKIYDGSTVIGSAMIGGDGKWSFTPSKDLSYGAHDLSVIETNPAGTSSAASAHVSFTVVVPAPVITNVIDAIGPIQGTVPSGGTTDDQRPSISGTGVAGNTVYIYANGRGVGDTIVDGTGHWSMQVDKNLDLGVNNLKANQFPAGQPLSVQSNIWTITVDVSVPAAPVIASVMDNVGAITGAIAAGGMTDDTRPVVSGTGKAGDLIKLYDGSTLIGSVTVGTDGKWSVQPESALSNAAHFLTATDTNAAGTVSPASAGFNFTVDTTTPVAPVISSVVDNVGVITGPISAGGLTDDPRPLISGTGKAGDLVKLYDGATLVGSATVGTDGKWSIKPMADLANGAHDLSATDTSLAGVTSATSTHFGFSVDTSTPPTPVITRVADWTDDGSALIGEVPSGSVIAYKFLTLVGTGTLNATINLYNGSALIGTMVVKSGGTWNSADLTDKLANGYYDFTVTETNAAGKESARSNHWTFTIDTSAPAAPTIASVMDNVGSITGAIKSGGVTDDARPVVNGTGKAGDLIKLYDGSALIGSATVGSDGKWSVQPTNPLSNAAHDLSVTDTNLAGTVSPASAHFGFTVNTATPATPAAPVITDNGSLVPSGGTMPDGHPVISGTGTSGDTIKVYDNGNVIGSTTIGSDGKWSYTPTTELSNGSHSITVIETNPAGTSSAGSNATNVTVNPAPQETVTITNLIDDLSGSQVVIPQNGGTYDTTPIVKGTVSSGLIAGETLAVYRDGAKVGTATMNGASWSFNDSGVSAGQHTYTAQIENTSGNGPVSNSYTFTEHAPPHVVSTNVVLSNGAAGLTLTGSISLDSTRGYLKLTTYDLNTGAALGSSQTIYQPGYVGTFIYSLTTIYTAVAPSNYYYVWGYSLSPSAGPYVNVMGIRGTTINQYKSSAYDKNYVVDPSLTVLIPGYASTSLKSTFTGLNAELDHLAAVIAADKPDDVSVKIEHHTVVGEHDAFKGTAGGNETVDLNANPMSYFKEATAHIEGVKGGAVDTLHLMGDHQILDLTSLTGKTAAAKISGIEVIDLGGQHNTLKLSLMDVLNLGETDLFQQDGKQQLMVNGKEGDVVDLSNSHVAGLAEGEWQQHGTTQVGGVTYNVYEHSGAHTELLIQQGVQIAVH